MKVAVIGGGVGGIAIAITAAEAGHDVWVYDLDRKEHQASFAAVGALNPLPPSSNSALSALQSRNRLLMPALIARIAESGCGRLNYRQNGRLQPLQTEDDVSKATKYVNDAQIAWNDENPSVTPASIVDASEMRQVFPFDLVASRLLYDRVSSWIEPNAYVSSALNYMATLGVKFVLAEVLGVTESSGLVQVEDREQTSVFSACFMATGINQVTVNGALSPRLKINRGQSVLLDIPSTRPVAKKAPTLFSQSTYLCHVQETVWVAGSTSKNVPDRDWLYDFEEEVDIIERVRTLLANIEHFQVIKRRVGYRPRSADNMPVLGPVDGVRIIYFNGLFKVGLGISLAMAEMGVKGLTPDGFSVDGIPTEIRANRPRAFAA